MRKAPLESNRLAYPFIFVGGAGRPFGAVGMRALGHANRFAKGSYPPACKSVEEGLMVEPTWLACETLSHLNQR